jgi:hypothetical protein
VLDVEVASPYLDLYLDLLCYTGRRWIRYMVFLLWFRFLGRLVSPSGCRHLDLLLRVPIFRLRLGLCLFFRFLVFFIDHFDSSIWPSVLRLRFPWLSAVFHDVALLPTVVTGSSWCPVSHSSQLIRSRWVITGVASKAIASCSVQIHRFGVWKPCSCFLSLPCWVRWLGET